MSPFTTTTGRNSARAFLLSASFFTCLTLSLATTASAGDDCNNNGVPDFIEIAEGAPDVNENGVIDFCEILAGVEQRWWRDGAGGFVAPASDWGDVVLHMDSSLAPLFPPTPDGGFEGWINIMIQVPGQQPLWTVRNFPMMIEDPLGLDGMVDWQLPCSLGTLPGQQVEFAHMGIQITPQPLPEQPQNPFVIFDVPILPDEVLYGGFIDLTGATQGSTAVNGPWETVALPWGMPMVPAIFLCPAECITIDEADVAEVDEDTCGCAPGSVARSLDYLNQQAPGLGLPDAQDIYEGLKGAMETDTSEDGGTYLGSDNPDGQRGIIPGKIDYLVDQGIANKITTTTSNSFADVAECLGEGADVEIIIDWGTDEDGDSLGGHMAFVVKMQAIKDAEGTIIGWIVTTMDDEDQGNGEAASDKSSYLFDADGNLVGYGDGAEAITFVVEKRNDESNPTVERVLDKLQAAQDLIDQLLNNPPADADDYRDVVNEIMTLLQAAARQIDHLLDDPSGNGLENFDAEAFVIEIGHALDALHFLRTQVEKLGEDQRADLLEEAKAAIQAALDLFEDIDECAADLDGSGDVGFPDLLILLASWGPCGGADCDADLNGNGVVDFNDLVSLLAAYGDCD